MMNRRSAFVLSAIALSVIGDSVVYVLLLLSASRLAVSWWVTGVVLANLLPPVLLAPILGSLVDRATGRTAWISAMAASALCVLGMAVSTRAWLVVACGALQSLCAVVVAAGSFAFLPRLQGMTQSRASSWIVGMGAVASIVGPPVAALLFGCGQRVAFGVVALAFLTAALAVAGQGPEVDRLEVDRATLLEVRAGLAAMVQSSPLRRLLPFVLIVVTATSIEGVAGVYYLQDVAQGYVGYSLMLVCWAAGTLAGAALGARYELTPSRAACVVYGGLGVSVAILIEGAVAVPAVIAVVFLAGGFANAIHNIGVRDMVYSTVDARHLGQAWAMVGAGFSAFSAIGNVLGTPAIWGGARPAVLIAGAIGTLAAIATMLAHRTVGAPKGSQCHDA